MCPPFPKCQDGAFAPFAVWCLVSPESTSLQCSANAAISVDYHRARLWPHASRLTLLAAACQPHAFGESGRILALPKVCPSAAPRWPWPAIPSWVRNRGLDPLLRGLVSYMLLLVSLSSGEVSSELESILWRRFWREDWRSRAWFWGSRARGGGGEGGEGQRGGGQGKRGVRERCEQGGREGETEVG